MIFGINMHSSLYIFLAVILVIFVYYIYNHSKIGYRYMQMSHLPYCLQPLKGGNTRYNSWCEEVEQMYPRRPFSQPPYTPESTVYEAVY